MDRKHQGVVFILYRGDAMENTVQLETIGQIAITVREPAVAQNFYQNILGLKLLFNAGSMIFFQCGATRLLIGTAETEKPFVAAGTILYFKVTDIASTHIALAERGAHFVAAPHIAAKMSDHDLWLAFLNDPDENTIGLMSEFPRPAA